MKFLFTVMVMLSAVMFAAQEKAAAPAKSAPVQLTIQAPGEPRIIATDMPNGMAFSAYKGKPVLLNFFGKNCRYCIREIPHLVAVKKKYGDRIGIIGMHVQERMGPSTLNNMKKRYGINYPIYQYDDNVAFVRHVGVRARYNGGIPFNIFFNANGDVIQIIPGYVSEAELDKIFAQMLAPVQ